nr:MAG TPA: hypothetical protein [Caudoviricetes sp.]
MSEYRIYNDLDTGDIMDCLSESEKVNFVYECFECLELYQQQDFIESLGADEVIDLRGEDEIIYELEMRGYKITKDE